VPKITKSNFLNLSLGLYQHREIATSVGLIISYWNMIENTVATTIFYPITGTDPLHSSKIVYALRNSGARLDILEESGGHVLKDAIFLHDFKKTIDMLRKALNVRNFYAHCVYAVDGDNKLIAHDPTEWHPKQPRFITEKNVAIDVEYMIKTYAQLNLLQSRLFEWQRERRPT
jgi:hypothetical protein